MFFIEKYYICVPPKTITINYERRECHSLLELRATCTLWQRVVCIASIERVAHQHRVEEIFLVTSLIQDSVDWNSFLPMCKIRYPFSDLIGCCDSVDSVSDIVVVSRIQAQEVVAGLWSVPTQGSHLRAVAQRFLPCLVLIHHHQVVIMADRMKLCGACSHVALFSGSIKTGTV